jgi:hypothetical protein
LKLENNFDEKDIFKEVKCASKCEINASHIQILIYKIYDEKLKYQRINSSEMNESFSCLDLRLVKKKIFETLKCSLFFSFQIDE